MGFSKYDSCIWIYDDWCFFIFYIIFNIIFGFKICIKLFKNKITLCLIIFLNIFAYLILYYFSYIIFFNLIGIKSNNYFGILISLITIIYGLIYLVFFSIFLRFITNLSYHESIKISSIPVVFGIIFLLFCFVLYFL
jgi:hypothetical protein